MLGLHMSGWCLECLGSVSETREILSDIGSSCMELKLKIYVFDEGCFPYDWANNVNNLNTLLIIRNVIPVYHD